MRELIRDTFYRLGSDKDGFRLERNPPHNPRSAWQTWEVISYREQVANWENILLAGMVPEPYWLPFLAFISSERPLRKAINRKLAHGSRNIRLDVKFLRKYISESLELILTKEEWALVFEVFVLHNNKKPTSAEKNEKALKFYSRYKKLLKITESYMSREMSSLFQKYGLPNVSDKNMWAYEINPNIINLSTNEDCRKYLRRVQGTEREPIFDGKLNEITAYLEEHFPAEANLLIERLKKSDCDALSALSLSTEQDKLLVSIVNPYGKFVRVEAWKFLKLVKEHGITQRWGMLTRKLYDEPEPLIKFCDMKTGVVFAKLWPEKWCIEVVCRPDSGSPDSPKAKSTAHEQAWFYVEPDYLVCLAVAIEKLLEDHERFTELVHKFETVVTHDPLDREIW